MKCINCQKEIVENSVYCSFCGKPTSIVPDYSIYDEDDLNILMEGAENAQKQISQEEAQKEEQRKLAEQKRLAAEQRKEEIRNAKLLEKKKQKQMQLTIFIIAFVCVFLVVIGVIIKTTIDNNNATSFDYQIKQAEAAVKKEDYDTAIAYYKKALEIDKYDLSARMDFAQLYFDMEEDEKAVALLLETVKLDKTAYDAYKSLISYYEKEEDVDAVLALLDGVTDSRVKNLFKNYIVESPKIHLTGGTYSQSVRITISANMNSSIYYTLDGSDPIKKGALYSGTIVLEKKGTYTLKTVAKNSRGVYSEVTSAEYVIEVNAPDDPIISLAETGEVIQGGTFTKETYISIYVPSGCTAYYTWENVDPTEEDGSLYYDPIAVPEGHNILSVIIIDNENEVSSAIFRGVFDYYPEGENQEADEVQETEDSQDLES